ncbi:MAG TPA: NAD(P)/FAD-dependent oxidoreductase, partial [Spirochaetia bacterium]|nr:NAD(P)/FAD-dependent oxidoreductase [Spirochaetia bacterium]
MSRKTRTVSDDALVSPRTLPYTSPVAPPGGKYDVCVIGGGPAGMIAAGRAAESGRRVLLLEKNSSPGRKLLITGGGRCNVTNAETRHQALVERYGSRGKFLHSLFARFGPGDLREFFRERGLETVVEQENRVFPATQRAASVLEVLLRYMQDGGVEVRLNTAVDGLETESEVNGQGRITGARSSDRVYRADAYIVATGGTSHPETGSTGDGFVWLRRIGHQVREPEASLVPIRVREDWVRALQGVALDDARLTARVPGAGDGADARCSERGKLLFTHYGLSGPLVLNMSTPIKELEKTARRQSMIPPGEGISLFIDLFPSIDHAALDRSVLNAFAAGPRRKPVNLLPAEFSLPARLVGVILRQAGITAEATASEVRKDERRRLVVELKALRLTFDGLLGARDAIVSSGGVALEEIDFRTMSSRLYLNLYLVGDILDFQRRSGGYSLQICWSSGWLAGVSAAVGASGESGVYYEKGGAPN